MLEIKFVRQNLPEIEKALSRRGQTADLETFKQYDAKPFFLRLKTLDIAAMWFLNR